MRAEREREIGRRRTLGGPCAPRDGDGGERAARELRTWEERLHGAASPCRRSGSQREAAVARVTVTRHGSAAGGNMAGGSDVLIVALI